MLTKKNNRPAFAGLALALALSLTPAAAGSGEAPSEMSLPEHVEAEYVITACGTVRPIPIGSTPIQVEFWYEYFSRMDCPGYPYLY